MGAIYTETGTMCNCGKDKGNRKTHHILCFGNKSKFPSLPTNSNKEKD